MIKSCNKMPVRLLFFLCCFVPVLCFAQKKRKVEAEGSWESVGDVSPAEARDRALLEAKKNALTKAGVGARVNVLSLVAMAQGSEKHFEEDDFSQLGTISRMGLVRILDEKEETESIKGGTLFRKKITAEVTKEVDNDPEFSIKVNGVKAVYRENEEFEFSVIASKDCYLRAFWFDDTVVGTGEVIYPVSQFNSDILLNAMQKYDFPLKEANKTSIRYTIKKSTTKPVEKCIVIFVASSKRILYNADEVSFEGFFQWYYDKLKPMERTDIQAVGFMIVK